MRRVVAAAGASAALVLLAWSVAGSGGEVPDIFQIRATYQDGHVAVSFIDTSGGTLNATMEILGMAETFHRTYHTYSFEESIPFPGPPRYGWGAHPIIFDIQHQSLGEVRIKTEIRDAGEAPAPMLLER